MKLIKASERPVVRHSSAGLRKPDAPKSTWQYLMLSCGHFTNSDAAALYAAFAVKPETSYCRRCNKYTEIVRLAPLPPQDKEPPF